MKWPWSNRPKAPPPELESEWHPWVRKGKPCERRVLSSWFSDHVYYRPVQPEEGTTPPAPRSEPTPQQRCMTP